MRREVGSLAHEGNELVYERVVVCAGAVWVFRHVGRHPSRPPCMRLHGVLRVLTVANDLDRSTDPLVLNPTRI